MKNGYTIAGDNVVAIRFSCLEEFNMVSGKNCHDKYEIIFSLSHLGLCNVEGSEYELTPRSILLIPPLSFHNHSFFEKNIVEGYSVSFSDSVLCGRVLDMLEKILSPDKISGKFYPSHVVCDALSDIFRRFDDVQQLKGEEQSAFLETLVAELVIFLSATEFKTISRNDQELGSRVAKYLNANIEKNISLDRLATRFFVSKYHLCRAFKKYSGVSVHSYINHKRIIHAKMLIESGQTASGAAECVGFGDYSAFYRAYVRIVGKAPTKE